MSTLQAVLHATRVTTSEDGSYQFIFAPCRQRIRAKIEGKTIADSERAIVLRETGQRREFNVACSYEAPYDSAAHVKDYVAFFPDRMDHWYQDEVLTATEMVDATPLPTNPLATWMIKAAWASASISDLVAAFATELVRTGIPLLRLSPHIRTLHPLLGATSLVWRRGRHRLESEPIPGGGQVFLYRSWRVGELQARGVPSVPFTRYLPLGWIAGIDSSSSPNLSPASLRQTTGIGSIL